MNLFSNLHSDWHATAPKDLLDAPVTVLKGVDEDRAAVLKAVLNVSTVRDLANQPTVDWVWRTFSLFRAGAQRSLPDDAAEHVAEPWQGRSCGEWLASPLISLKVLDEASAHRLGATLGWVTVRHLANDTVCATAREISRIVTGEPTPPEDRIVKPLPNYFSGGTQRFLARAREAAGVAPPPPPPPRPAPPAAARPPAPVVAAAPADKGDQTNPSGHPSPGIAMPKVPATYGKDYTPDGVYIPRGGGTRGWVENQGIARAERANRYGYEHAVDLERFQRAGLQEMVRANLRGAERKELRMQVRWTGDPDKPPIAGLCLDISLTGAKLRLGQGLPKDTPVQVTWVDRDDLLGAEQPLVTLDAIAVWNKSVNSAFRTPRFDCGVHFAPMSLEAQRRLTLLLTGKLDELRAAGPPQEEEG